MSLTPNMTLAESKSRLYGGLFVLIASVAALVLPWFFAKEFALYGWIGGGVGLLGGLFMLFEYKKRWCVAKCVLGMKLPEDAQADEGAAS